MNKIYSTDLTDIQWQFIENILNDSRKREHDLRIIWNGILYSVKTGCQWRMLPKEFPHWSTVYYYFKKWKCNGVFEDVLDKLNERKRKLQKKNVEPSVGIIDSQLEGQMRLPYTIDIIKKKLNKKLEVLGVLQTKYDSRLSLTKRVEESLKEIYDEKLFETRIRKNVALAEAPSERKTIFEYDPGSNGAQDYLALAEEVITRTEKR